jgi:predicted HTH transcriptional regulator
MSAMGLPEPVFSQKEIGYALVRVTLKNNIEQRKVWIDRDVSNIIGHALAARLTEEEKRILNLVAELGHAKVNDIVRSMGVSWQRAHELLTELWKMGVLQYVRFRPLEKNLRDPNAFFRLRSVESLPDGSHEPDPID